MSGNTSTLTSKMNGSPAVSTQKKITAAATAPSVVPPPSYRPPSYAAALKSGVVDEKDGNGPEANQFSGLNQQQQTDFNNSNISLYPPLGNNLEVTNRTSRALSEPIRLDQFDNNRLDFPLNNNHPMGWFESNNNVLAPLNDRSTEKTGLGPLTSSAFPSQQSVSSNEFSLFSTPSRASSGGLFSAEPRSQGNSGNGPPSPEAWSKLINGLSNNSDSAAQSQQKSNGGFYSLLNSGNDNQGWGNNSSEILHGLGHSSFGESTSLFPESTTAYRQRSASRDENGSLILGITQQARSSRSNSDVEFLQSQRRYSHDLLESSGTLSQFSDFSLDGSRQSFDQNNNNIWSTGRR